MPGLHTLAAQRPLHRALTKTINAAAGDRLTIDMAPQEMQPASLVVRASPEDAELAIDGKVVGVGTYRGELPPGGTRDYGESEGSPACSPTDRAGAR